IGASYPGGSVVTNNVIFGSLVLPRGSCISVCPCNSAPEPPHIRTANARVKLRFTTGRIIIVDLLNWRLSISGPPLWLFVRGEEARCRPKLRPCKPELRNQNERLQLRALQGSFEATAIRIPRRACVEIDQSRSIRVADFETKFFALYRCLERGRRIGRELMDHHDRYATNTFVDNARRA